MRLKDLEAALQPLRRFAEANPILEQYPTSSHLASRMLFTAHSSYDEIADKKVLDLGCGCGVLTIAANLCGASYVLGIDIDGAVLKTALENTEEAEVEDEIDFVQADVAQLNIEGCPLLERIRAGSFDTVYQIQNPPFGTKVRGIDKAFLEVATKVARTSIYSLHKTSTRDYIAKQVQQLGFKGQVLAQLRYDLPKSMAFHKKASLDVEVDFWRFERITKLTN